MKEKVLKAKIMGAPKNYWYSNDIGKIVKVVPFTHNSYLKHNTCNLCYRAKDLRIINKIRKD